MVRYGAVRIGLVMQGKVWSLECDEAAPGWVRQAAHFVVEAAKEWREGEG